MNNQPVSNKRTIHIASVALVMLELVPLNAMARVNSDHKTFTISF